MEKTDNHGKDGQIVEMRENVGKERESKENKCLTILVSYTRVTLNMSELYIIHFRARVGRQHEKKNTSTSATFSSARIKGEQV